MSEGDLAAVKGGGLPTWLIMFSLACIGLFVAGLVVYLQRGGAPASEASPPAGSGSAVAGSGSGSGSAAPTPDAGPRVPDGMILVKRADGSSVAIGARLVSAAEYRTVFADHTQPGGPEDPAVSITYDKARSFARTKGNRLVRAGEWEAASTQPGFISRDGVFEWVEPGDDKKNVVQHGKAESRSDAKEYKDVGFRMARDI